MALHCLLQSSLFLLHLFGKLFNNYTHFKFTQKTDFGSFLCPLQEQVVLRH